MHRDEAWRTAKERLLSEKPMRSHIEPVQDMLCAFIKLDFFQFQNSVANVTEAN